MSSKSHHHSSHPRHLDPGHCEESIRSIPKHPNHHSHPAHCHAREHCHVQNVSWRLLTMIALNGIVFIAELISGYITHSLSLQSDAWHMLSDEASLIIGLVAHHLSKRLHSPTMTFGFGRLEVLGGLVNATFLIAICVTITVDAIERFLNPPEIEQPQLFFVVGFIGLITNFIGLIMFHNHSHSDNMRGVFLHVLGDFIGSIGVMVTAALHLMSLSPIRRYVDPLFSLLIVMILVHGSLKLFLRTAFIVVEKCPESVNSDDVLEELLTIDGVIAVHDLHIWELSKDRGLAMVHVVVKSRDCESEVLCKVQNVMIAHEIHSTTIQIETNENFPDGVDPLGHCAFASSIGGIDRAFVSEPVYRHAVGCPHWNAEGKCPKEKSDGEDE